MVLRTVWKDKISHTLSYPVGAEVVSEFVGELARAEQFSLWFSGRATWWASEWNRILRAGEPYRVLEARLMRHDNRVNNSSDNIEWQISIFPVLRERKAAARAGLIEVALPALALWLDLTGTSKGRSRVGGLFTAIFDPDAETVQVLGAAPLQGA